MGKHTTFFVCAFIFNLLIMLELTYTNIESLITPMLNTSYSLNTIRDTLLYYFPTINAMIRDDGNLYVADGDWDTTPFMIITDGKRYQFQTR